MTKKEYCLKNKAFSYYSGLGGVEIHGIEHGIYDYIYCTSNSWYGKKSFHKVKTQYTRTGNPFFVLHGYRIPLDECIRMGV